METILRSLLLEYYQLSMQLIQAENDYSALEDNKHSFSNQTSVDDVQVIIDHKIKRSAKEQEINQITVDRSEKETDIVELFSLAGIPIEHKIEVSGENGLMSFWFDKEEDLQYSTGI